MTTDERPFSFVMSNTMRVFSCLILPILCLACSDGASHSVVPARAGPEFAVAFPDPTLLVTGLEVEELRSLLKRVSLPETAEHHQLLVQLLQNAEQLDTQHLQLVTEAVSRDPASAAHMMVTIVNGETELNWSRGGKNSAVIDELLLAGVGKLSDPSPENLGHLLNLTQSEQTLLTLVAHCANSSQAADWDDGSARDLEQILSTIAMESVRLELCLGALLPAGLLDEDRMQVALRNVSSDSGLLQLIGADYERRSSLPLELCLSNMRRMSFDEGRVAVIQLGSELLPELSVDALMSLMRTVSFDEGRVQIAETLAKRTKLESASGLRRVLRLASFDKGRAEVLALLVSASAIQLDGSELISLTRQASFGAGRIQFLRILQPHLRTPLSMEDIRGLLSVASFDPERSEILTLFADELRELDRLEQEKILGTFSSSSSRIELIRALGW